MSIDVAFKVLRTDTVLSYISQLRDEADQKGKDYKDLINEAIVNATCVTK